MNDLTRPPKPTALAPGLAKLADEAREIIAAGVPENTRRTYRAQWNIFQSWCRLNDRQLLPADEQTVILFLTARSNEVKVSTLEVSLAAITVAHREAGLEDWAASDLPGVRVFMRGLRRMKGSAPVKKDALSFGDLKAGLPQGDEPDAVQARAVLLVGFFGALRRSELVSLDFEDIRRVPKGLSLLIRSSKTDKESAGQTVYLPRLADESVCPVRALQRWVEVQQILTGPVFLSLRSGLRMRTETVVDIVKDAAERAGLDPKHFAAHSLRSGFATSAARAKAEEREIMRVTRHRSERTVREYIREGQVESHPGFLIAAEDEDT